MKFQGKNGKEIKELIWICTESDGTTDYQRKKPTLYERIYLSYEYYGNHAQIWAVVEKVETGIEIMRYNIKNIDTIVWV